MNLVLNEEIAHLAFLMMRPLGMTLLFPLLQAGNLGSPLVRNAVLMALALPMLAVVPVPEDIGEGWTWLSYIPGELLIGLVLGFCGAIPFWAVDMAGFIIDSLRGATMSAVFNPAMSVQSSLFGLLFSQFLCALFFISGGINLHLSVLYDSYHYLPPGNSLTFNQPLLDFIKVEWQTLYHLCLSFCLPAVLVMVLADMALGLLNRSAQQLNVFFLAMPIKSLLVLLLLIVSLPYALHHYLVESERLYQHVGEWFAQHE